MNVLFKFASKLKYNIKKIRKVFVLTAAAAMLVACKKEGCTDETAINYSSEAKKDDGSCKYETSGEESYTIPTTYEFTDANGNSTVSYGGQIDRLNQLEEMVVLMKSGTEGVVAEQTLLDMYANTGDNGGGNFSFTSTKQLENKTFSNDVQMFKNWMSDLATASHWRPIKIFRLYFSLYLFCSMACFAILRA